MILRGVFARSVAQLEKSRVSPRINAICRNLIRFSRAFEPLQLRHLSHSVQDGGVLWSGHRQK